MPPSDTAPTSLPSTASPEPLSALQLELIRKAELEAAMIAAPFDTLLRASYFDELIRFASVRSGLSHALLPELGYPLALRCGTTDIVALARVFRSRAYDFPMRASPARILILGAYVGYSAVFLAHRFPAARILCVEPAPASFRLLEINTRAFKQIETQRSAVWHSPTRLGVQSRSLGDWGQQLHDQIPDAERNIPALTVSEILRVAGWDQVDMVVCDMMGGELAMLADPRQRWLHTLDTFAASVSDANFAAFSTAMQACLEPTLHEYARHGDFHVFERHSPFRALPRPLPRAMPLISAEPGHFPIGLQDTPATPWGFYIFDGESCQIHPNGPGERPARAVFPRTLDGHSRFTTTLLHAGRPSAPIVFTVIIAGEDGTELVRQSWTVNPGERQDVDFSVPPLHGRHHLLLQTEMAAGAPYNYNAWAQFLAPRVA
ncbi:MAG: FkbM family methyltransferase [Alphaproteobacteria bacterium]|nr:FkbM family methyltransferase [Alphaproteobacteria bacterium]